MGRTRTGGFFLLCALALGACVSSPSETVLLPVVTPTLAPTPTPTPSTYAGPLAQLATLQVKGRAPKTGYDRAAFGSAWADVDRNGCDTRNDILRRDLVDLEARAGTHDCVVVSGTLHEPYTGAVLTFSKAQSGEIEIDHVVALSDAWQKGAQSWTADKRRAFANDPLELLAVSRTANRAKSAADAASWLPPYKGYRCAFVARQVAVKAKYGLWVTAAERDAIRLILSRC